MSNMSYCMFSNTLADLRDCVEKLNEIDYNISQLSEAEQKAAKKLFKLCLELGQGMEE